jgi:hypothetical protein
MAVPSLRIKRDKTALEVGFGGAVRTPGVFDLAASPTAIDLASKFTRGRDMVLPESSHYIPMERPDAVIAEIRRLLQELLLVE